MAYTSRPQQASLSLVGQLAVQNELCRLVSAQ